MPKFLEAKLKKEYPNNPGAVYGTMNAIGAMKGSKETPKGKAMEKKHNLDKALHGLSAAGTGKAKKVVDMRDKGKIKTK